MWKKRRKENKEKGKEVKRKVKIVEDHFDDCGTDLSGLAKVADEVDDYYVEFADDSEDEIDDNLMVENLCMYWFKG